MLRPTFSPLLRLTVFIGVSIICLIVVIIPAYQRLASNLAIIVYAQKTLANQYRETANLRQTRPLLTALRENQSALQALFLVPGAELSLITTTEQAAQELGLGEIITLTDAEPGPSATLLQRNLHLTSTGPLINALRLLAHLETGNPLIAVQKVSLVPAPNQPELITLSIEAKTFIRP